jgi:hypothetical protein
MLHPVMVLVCAVPQQGSQITSPLQEQSSLLLIGLSSMLFRKCCARGSLGQVSIC